MTETEKNSRGLSQTQRGILWMLFAFVLFPAINAMVKYMDGLGYTLPQIAWARFFGHAVVYYAILGPRLGSLLRTRRPGLQILHSALVVGILAPFFWGLTLLPLADASALMFISPLIVTTLSIPLLGEHVGVRRWVCVCIGFLGAMIIIRPGFGVMQVAAVLPLAAACFQALYQITTRMLAGKDSVMTTMVYTPLVGAVGSSLIVPFYWFPPPDVFGWGMLAALGVFGLASQFALIKAFNAAPASVVTPFGYTHLLWATLFGFLLFGHLPDTWTVTGAAIIAASGLYVFHRESMQRQKDKDAGGTVPSGPPEA